MSRVTFQTVAAVACKLPEVEISKSYGTPSLKVRGKMMARLLEDHGVVTFEPTDSGTRMTTVTRFADTQQFHQLEGMGMEEGMREAMTQIDDVLAETTR